MRIMSIHIFQNVFRVDVLAAIVLLLQRGAMKATNTNNKHTTLLFFPFTANGYQNQKSIFSLVKSMLTAVVCKLRLLAWALSGISENENCIFGKMPEGKDGDVILSITNGSKPIYYILRKQWSVTSLDL